MTQSGLDELKQKARVKLLLTQLADLKDEVKNTQTMIGHVQQELEERINSGDLEDFRDSSSENLFRYDGKSYTFCSGKQTFDFSECPEVDYASKILASAKEIAIAAGMASKKYGKSFFKVF